MVTALRMWAQSKLATDVDGVWGAGSRVALTTWQRANGLPGAGSLDDATLAALAGAGARGLDDEEPVMPLDAGWPEWALDALAPEAPVAPSDALEALLTALEQSSPASRRAVASRLLKLLDADLAAG